MSIPALPEGWRGSFEALLDQHARGAAGNQGLAGPATPPAWSGLRRFRVAAARHESATVRSLRLEPVDGGPLPEYAPGQFLALKLRPGGAASAYLHDALAEGDVLEVGAPRGDFTLDATATGAVVLVSAGVGVTPVLAMLGAVARSGGDRPVW